jgi:hypothetical protein
MTHETVAFTSCLDRYSVGCCHSESERDGLARCYVHDAQSTESMQRQMKYVGRNIITLLSVNLIVLLRNAVDIFLVGCYFKIVHCWRLLKALVYLYVCG